MEILGLVTRLTTCKLTLKGRKNGGKQIFLTYVLLKYNVRELFQWDYSVHQAILILDGNDKRATIEGCRNQRACATKSYVLTSMWLNLELNPC